MSDNQYFISVLGSFASLVLTLILVVKLLCAKEVLTKFCQNRELLGMTFDFLCS
jgi:hypothetical protein